MTKEQKSIINKDLKKYKSLVKYTEGETQDIYTQIVTFLEKIIMEN